MRPAADLIVVALGSNLGDSVQVIHRAMGRLRTLSINSFESSSLWRSAPVDCPPGSPDFINAVVAFDPAPGQTPESLLPELQAIEREFGRTPKKVLNEARPLDLDLIAFGSQTRSAPSLVLPHPRAHQRRFVLQPLAEICPNLVLPGQTRTVSQLLSNLPPGPELRRVK